METYLHYLAPVLAVIFFVLLGIVIYCYYHKTCIRKEEDNMDEQKEQLNDGDDDAQGVAGHFVEKKRSHSAVNDYFVVVHL